MSADSSSSLGQAASSSATNAATPAASAAASVSSTPISADPPSSSAQRAAFFAASNAARVARKREKHERAQAALTAAHQIKLADERLEALEWCRKHLQISEQAQAARSSGQCRPQRCIVLLQFAGTAYKGMQLQNRQNKESTRSIEGTLLHALFRSGAIDDSMHSIQDIRWQRTARTDAGVHAAFNVFSCILLYDDGLLERLRTELPVDIGVLSIMSPADFASAESETADPPSRKRSASSSATAASTAAASASVAAASSSACVAIAAPPSRAHPFHAKDSCTGRLYEYILPTAMWASEARASETAAVVAPLDSTAASSAAASSSPEAALASIWPTALPASNGTASAIAAVFSPAPSKPAPPSRLPYNGASMSPAHSSFDFDSFASVRLDAATSLPQLNALLARFVGTKSFHNFGTPAATGPKKHTQHGAGETSPPSSASSSRSGSPNRSPCSAAAAAASSPSTRRSAPRNPAQKTVFSFTVTEVFDRDGVEYCRLVIAGRSFILHQIRKMIGLAVLVQRGVVADSIFDTVFDVGCSFDVPAIPARGLLLLRPSFDRYDAACDAAHQPHCSIARAFHALQPRIAQFRRDVLEKEICEARVSHAAYRAWIKSVQDAAKAKANKQRGQPAASAATSS